MTHSNRIYGYLRASTSEQDATRSQAALTQFAQEKGFTIAGWFTETISGTSLKRPKLFELLNIALPGDAILVEQIDRISRLNKEDWQQLKMLINENHIRIIALDLPTSHNFVSGADEFTNRMLDAVNGMLLDMLAAIAHKDYTDRRRRQFEGQAKARIQNPEKYVGKQINKVLHQNINDLLKAGYTYTRIQGVLGCSRTTIAKAKKADTEKKLLNGMSQFLAHADELIQPLDNETGNTL